MEKYKSVVVTARGGPEVLQVIENDLCLPSAGEARIKVLAEKKIEPIMADKYPILEAAEANKQLERGVVIGTQVLLAPELL